MKISLIVAVGPQREIGHLGKMPWNYPSEYAHFLRTVSGHCIVLGRINFIENLSNAPLLGRVTSLVISSQKKSSYFFPSNSDWDIQFFYTVREAIDFARKSGEKELFIIGGEKIYRDTLLLADKIYYSIVPYSGPVDRFFPEIPKNNFLITEHKKIQQTLDAPAWDLYIYEKIKNN